MTTPSTPSDELARIVEAAGRLGIELDEGEALRWLTAIAAEPIGDQVVLDIGAGVYGHRVSMLDFSTADLDRFRRIGQLVGFADGPGVETALALSGSAAQSKVQTHPGDCDFFERVNIHAATRDDACRILAELMREKALGMERGDGYRLIEVKFGSAPIAFELGGRPQPAGSALTWRPAEIAAGELNGTSAEGKPARITWDEAAVEPGWCKLDWVVADPKLGTLVNASNMLDATWEAPDGSIAPLDGHLDGYFQEVYLEADSIPIFSKVVKHASADSLDAYVAQLEHEVAKYVTTDPNYGKAAKRMYNVFRLTARYEEAAYIRELFDEPAAMLYQVWALLRTLDDALSASEPTTLGDARAHADTLVAAVMSALDGPEEAEIVSSIVELRAHLDDAEADAIVSPGLEAARGRVINLVNSFFHDRLVGIPQIKSYLDGLSSPEPSATH